MSDPPDQTTLPSDVQLIPGLDSPDTIVIERVGASPKSHDASDVDQTTLPSDVQLIPGLDSPDIIPIERVDTSPKSQDASDVNHDDHTVTESVPPVSESLAEFYKLNTDVRAGLANGRVARETDAEPSHAEQSVIEADGFDETPRDGITQGMADSSVAEQTVSQELMHEDDYAPAGDKHQTDDPHMIYQPDDHLIESGNAVLQEDEPVNSRTGEEDPLHQDMAHFNGIEAPGSEDIRVETKPNEPPVEDQAEETKKDAHDATVAPSDTDTGKEVDLSQTEVKVGEDAPIPDGNGGEAAEEPGVIGQTDHKADEQVLTESNALPDQNHSTDMEETKVVPQEETMGLINADAAKEERPAEGPVGIVEADAGEDSTATDGEEDETLAVETNTETVGGVDALTVTSSDEAATVVAEKQEAPEPELDQVSYDETQNVFQERDDLTTGSTSVPADEQDPAVGDLPGFTQEVASQAEDSLATSIEEPKSTFEEQSKPPTFEPEEDPSPQEPENKPESVTAVEQSEAVAAPDLQGATDGDKESHKLGFEEVKTVETPKGDTNETNELVPQPEASDAVADPGHVAGGVGDDNFGVINEDEDENNSETSGVSVVKSTDEAVESPSQAEMVQDDVPKTSEVHPDQHEPNPINEEFQLDASPAEEEPLNANRVTEGSAVAPMTNTGDASGSPGEVSVQTAALVAGPQQELNTAENMFTHPASLEESTEPVEEVNPQVFELVTEAVPEPPQEHIQEPLTVPPADAPEEPAGSNNEEGNVQTPRAPSPDLPQETAEEGGPGHSPGDLHSDPSDVSEFGPAKVEKGNVVLKHEADPEPMPIEGEHTPLSAPQIHTPIEKRPETASNDDAGAQVSAVLPVVLQHADETYAHDPPMDKEKSLVEESHVDALADDTDQDAAADVQPAMLVKGDTHEDPTPEVVEMYVDAQPEVVTATEAREDLMVDQNVSVTPPAHNEGLMQVTEDKPLPLTDETTHATSEGLPIVDDTGSTDAPPTEELGRIADEKVLPLMDETSISSAEEPAAHLDDSSTRSEPKEDRQIHPQGGEVIAQPEAEADGIADRNQGTLVIETPDFTTSETPKDPLADVNSIIVSSHTDREVVEKSEERHSLLERVHDRAFSGDSIEGLPQFSPEDDAPAAPYPPSDNQYATPSGTEDMELQESRLTPVQTFTDPDVVIIQDDHVPLSDEPYSAPDHEMPETQPPTESSGSSAISALPSGLESSPPDGYPIETLIDGHTFTQEATGTIDLAKMPEPAREDQPAETTDEEPKPVHEVDEPVVTYEAEATSEEAPLERDNTLPSVSQTGENELLSKEELVAKVLTSVQEPHHHVVEEPDISVIHTTASKDETPESGVSAASHILLAAEIEKAVPVEPEPETPSISLEAKGSTPAMDDHQVNPDVSAPAEDRSTAPEQQSHIPDTRPSEETALPSASHDVSKQAELDEFEEESDESASPTMAKGPRITRVLLDRPPQHPEPSLEAHSQIVAPEETTANAEDSNISAEVDVDRSDVPEVATTPRSDLGVLTPFDSRSEVSAASNEPIPPQSPRTDPSSPLDGDFDFPALSLNGTLAPSTDPEIIAKPDGPPQAVSEASVDPIPPSSPVQEITPLTTPTRHDSTPTSPAPVPDAAPITSIKGSNEYVQEVQATAGDVTEVMEIPIKTRPLEGVLHESVPDAFSGDLQSPPHSTREELTPRKSEGDLPMETTDDTALQATNSQTPTPSTITGPPPTNQLLEEKPIKDDSNLLRDMQPRELMETGKAQPSGPAPREVENFPSQAGVDPRDRAGVQYVPMPQDEDDEPSDRSTYLDIPPSKPRTRLASTASSRLLPGGWSDSPRPQGRASLEMATGEFSPPIRARNVGEEAEGVAEPKKKSRLSCVIM